jgi:acyl-CoA dehydrogenase
MPDAYPAMALPFRDVEDTVGTANVSGLLDWLLEKSAARIERSEANALRLAHRGSGVAGARGVPACGCSP